MTYKKFFPLPIYLCLAASVLAGPDLKPSLPLRGPGTGPTGSVSGPLKGPSPKTAISTSWEGLHSDFVFEPPDTHGAAGPNGIIAVVNLRIAYFDKSGNLLWVAPLDGMFAGVGNNAFTFDPHATYDPQSGRFYVTVLEQDTATTNSFLNIAVSKTSNPFGSTAGDWFLYRATNTLTVGTNHFWGDYPGLGYDSSAIYTTVNMYDFNDNYSGRAQIGVFDKASLLGGTLNVNFVYTRAQDFAFTLQPCKVYTTANPGNVAYFAETVLGDSTHVRVWSLTDPLGARTLANALVTVPNNGGFPPFFGAPQPGTSLTIDTLIGQTQGNAFWFNGSLWFCHTAGGTTGKSIAYYYKVNLNGFPIGTPTLGEEGYFDGGQGEWTYQPSIGGNMAGDVCVVYSQSSSSRYPTIMATTRKASALNFDAPVVIKSSPGFYFGFRWGDFATVSLDPADDSFWIAHEWARTTSFMDWSTWWANVQPRLAPDIRIATNYIVGGNGNGIIDINECNDLFIVLTNIGTLGASNIQATISTTTPGAILTQRTTSYPDLTAPGSGTNLVSFKLSTGPGFICGIPIVCTLLVKSDQIVVTNTLTMPTGIPGIPLRFDNFTSTPIPDASETSSTVLVTNVNFAINKMTVSLYATHTFDQDLTFQLISPDGVTNTLSANHGGSGQNYGIGCIPDGARTTFDDAAPLAISAAASPFQGSFQPDQPLSLFAGKSGTNVNGIWRLRVADNALGNVGTLQCWSILLTPSTCADGGGECPGSDLTVGMTANPIPAYVLDNLTYTISVTNNGPSTANNVTVSHVLPPSVGFVTATTSQGGWSQSGGVVSFNLGTMAGGSVATLTTVVRPQVQGVISSTATVSASQPDPDPSNNSTTLALFANPITADLSLSLVATPPSTVLGGPLTYNVSLVNNGPSTDDGVMITNTLPPSMSVVSAVASQGRVDIYNNLVVCSLGTLANSAQASATINVIPNAEGTMVTTSTAVGNQFDPNSANNSASVVTVVGPSADLAVSIAASPNPVVQRSNLTFVVTVTNSGPSLASSVIANMALPSGVTLISTSTTQGSLSVQGNSLMASIGTILKGAKATITIVVQPTAVGPISLSASASGTQFDPNQANNSAVANVTVAPPFVSIVPAGSALISESVSPPDGAIEPGETVTVLLSLRNAGNVRNTNLLATLLTNSGVIPVPPNATQNYRQLAPSGQPVSKSFSFTANGAPAQTITATLQLVDGSNNIGTVSFNFKLTDVHQFSNTTYIAIRDTNSALPYPSTIIVAGLTGVVGKVTATLSNLSHTYPSDIDALLVAPAGQNTILMSGAGAAVANADVIFDDGSAAPIPDNTGEISTGSYRPADYFPGWNLPAPAPAGPYPAAMSALNSPTANGTWSLYVDDHMEGDTGSIAGGWSLTLTTISPVNQLADLGITALASPAPSLAAGTLTYLFTVTNAGPNNASFAIFTNTLPASVQFISASSSQGSVSLDGNNVIGNLGPMSLGATATVTVAVSPLTGGLLTNTATVNSGETDLNLANNTVSLVSTVNLPLADAGVSITGAPNPVVIGSNLTYSIVVTNSGPGIAINTLLTDTLPPQTAFVSATSTAGPCTNSAGVITCGLGNLSPNSSAILTIVVTPSAAGSLTNTASVGTGSSDSNGGNNTALSIVTSAPPAPQIIAAGAALLAESFIPHDGAIDPGETVTLSLGLQNVGSLNTTNLVATLLNTNGVTITNGAQKTYGALLRGGAAVSNSYTFTASGSPGGTLTATLQLQDGAQNLGTVSFAFSFPAVNTFSNSAAIVIPDHGAGTPYPSTITTSSLTGLVGKATVALNGFSHSFPHDVSVLLVAPSGRSALVMSHVGGGYPVTNLVLNFDDAAAAAFSTGAPLYSATNKPVSGGGSVTFPSPAAPAPYGTTLSSVNGGNPNGNWSLFVFDDTPGDAGSISAGWSLTLTTVTTINPIADLAVGMSSAPASLFVGATFTNTISVTNYGPVTATGVILTNTLPSGASLLSASVSQGSYSLSSNGVVTCNLGMMASGTNARVVIAVVPTKEDTVLNTAGVSGNQSDLNPFNNVIQTPTAILSPMQARLSDPVVQSNLFQFAVSAQPGLPYRIQGSTNLINPNWVDLTNFTLPASGVFKFTDTSYPNFKYRFYRVVRQLP
jgi:uncharacterized repeat protein (TIGR01451 family)